jgi:hypothetical protein
MKNLKILLYPLAFILLISFTGCEKLSNEELLTDHVWKFKEITTDSNNETVIGLIALTNALMTGATLEFFSDGTYALTAGSSTDDGTWNLVDDNTLMMDTDEMDIVKLTKDELVLGGETVSNDYGTYTVTMSFIK